MTEEAAGVIIPAGSVVALARAVTAVLECSSVILCRVSSADKAITIVSADSMGRMHNELCCTVIPSTSDEDVDLITDRPVSVLVNTASLKARLAGFGDVRQAVRCRAFPDKRLQLDVVGEKEEDEEKGEKCCLDISATISKIHIDRAVSRIVPWPSDATKIIRRKLHIGTDVHQALTACLLVSHVVRFRIVRDPRGCIMSISADGPNGTVATVVDLGGGDASSPLVVDTPCKVAKLVKHLTSSAVRNDMCVKACVGRIELQHNLGRVLVTTNLF